MPEENIDPKAGKNKAPKDDAKKPDEPESEQLQRRAFFVEGFRSLLKPIGDLVETRLDHLERSFKEAQRVAPSASVHPPPRDLIDSSRLLRPPGALAEDRFVDRCDRSGECVAACPVQAIKVIDDDSPGKKGTPYIDPQIQACVVCDDLACMQVCPSGALQKLPRHLINMGMAELREDLCLRADGEDCQICVEKCPIGEEALYIPYQGADVEVKTEGCVGCGVCEMYCPTTPAAIVVKQE